MSLKSYIVGIETSKSFHVCLSRFCVFYYQILLFLFYIFGMSYKSVQFLLKEVKLWHEFCFQRLFLLIFRLVQAISVFDFFCFSFLIFNKYIDDVGDINQVNNV